MEERGLANKDNTKISPCPLCGKEFKVSQEAKRILHLKECGTLLGLRAEDLVNLRRLEVMLIYFVRKSRDCTYIGEYHEGDMNRSSKMSLATLKFRGLILGKTSR